MGIVSRFINVIRAYSSSFLDKAEDPAKMLQQMITDLDEQKRQAKQQMTEALALQKRLERDTEKEQAEAGKWEQKAILAVQNGKDDLAKEALVRKKEFERRALEFEKQLAHHKQNADVLRDGYQKLEDKIDEIKRKKGLLLAKQKQAEAQEKIYQTIEGFGNSTGALETIERMEDKIEDQQSRAEAYQEISMDTDKEVLERKFAELESSDPDLETELLELKKRAALPSPEGDSGDEKKK